MEQLSARDLSARVFTKLGVETRTAAALRVWEMMGRPRDPPPAGD